MLPHMSLKNTLICKKPDTKGHILYDSIFEMSKIGKSMEIESRLRVAREWGRVEWGLTANGFFLEWSKGPGIR